MSEHRAPPSVVLGDLHLDRIQLPIFRLGQVHFQHPIFVDRTDLALRHAGQIVDHEKYWVPDEVVAAMCRISALGQACGMNHVVHMNLGKPLSRRPRQQD